MYSNTFGRWNKFSQIIWFILHLIGYCCAIDYEFRIDLLPPCADNSKNIARLEYLDFAKMTHNRFSTNGTLVVDAVLKDPFRLVLVTTRCSNDKNVCEEFNELVINDVCGKLLNGGYAIIEELLTKFTPRMSCPMQPGKYYWTNGIIDLEMVARLPLTGFSWVTSLNAYQAVGHNKFKQVFCYNIRANLIKINHLRQKKTRKH